MWRLAQIGLVLLLLALDWAALHDIIKGEPDLKAEYSMLVVSLFVFVMMALAWRRAHARN
jgi:hypothetical protein